ncbi:carbohydrate kinase family protein [Candidatus Saccharibacteria bacterium]|nr:carbohydrate kinase family protein [Candidatus Saccharibacteria bacterium]
MAKKLERLLAPVSPLFSQAIHQLERQTSDSVDVRLIADVSAKAHEIIRALKLDLQDTTAIELYQALNAAVPTGLAERLLDDADYILYEHESGEVISFNLLDVIENAHHEFPFEERRVIAARRALRGELAGRYIAHTEVDSSHAESVLKQAEIVHHDDVDIAPRVRSDKQAPYILAIGDIFTDAFIKLREDKAKVSTDENGDRWLSVPFGSKPPYERVDIVQAVGPSPNAAVSFSRLGVQSGLMAYLGDDQPGRESLAYLREQGIDTSTISVQSGVASNYYYVLRYGAERTILVKNESYNYQWQSPPREPDWLYLSLLSADSWQLHQDMLAYLEEHPHTKLAFQPGTFHFDWGVEKLRDVYERSFLVVMNKEEAIEVTGQSNSAEIRTLCDGLHALGPKIVVITDGPNGSFASDGAKLISVPNYPDPQDPLDRTGAGDAFASTITAALALGHSLETALTWAPINSMNVVQHIGAQAGLLPSKKIDEYLSAAPDWYKLEEI